MPQRPKTPMEKYRAGLPLTPSERWTVNRILERNRLAKINIGNKYSKGAAGMTALDRKLLKEKKERLKKKKKKNPVGRRPGKVKPSKKLTGPKYTKSNPRPSKKLT